MPARAGWSRPFRIAQPFSLDVLAPQLALSASAGAAVAFGVQDADAPATSSAYVASGTSGGRLLPPRRVPDSQQVLGLVFDGNALELLTGTSPPGLACCSSAGVLRMSGGRSFGAPRTLVRRLAGATAGRMLAFSGRLLAAVATERGVWVAQSSGAGRFSSVHLLSASDARPEALDAATAGSGATIVAWTERDRRSPVPRRIFMAAGSARSAPGGARAAVTVPGGHRIDELALADGGLTVAWIESWYDRRGSYHSQVELADLAHVRRTRSFAISGSVASGLSFAADPGGDQLLAWKTCAINGGCSVRETLRRTSGHFAGPSRLGSIDAAGSPDAALAPSGEGLIGWIDRGHVVAADLRPSATRFGAPGTVSATNYAADLALSFGPTGTALAAWSQGTLAPVVIGASFRGG